MSRNDQPDLLDCHPSAADSASSTTRGSQAAPTWSTSPGVGGPDCQLDHRVTGPPGPWTLPRIRRYLGWPQVSASTLDLRVRLVAIWQRPTLTVLATMTMSWPSY
jgi:hypothetical protein